MPISTGDDNSPQNTNIYGDPVLEPADEPRHTEPSEPTDSFNDSYNESAGAQPTDKEPDQFKTLSRSDQIWFKTLDRDIANFQFNGEYYGAAAGVVIAAVLRARFGLPIVPFARGPMPERRILQESTNYLNHIVFGSLIGRLNTNVMGWSQAEKRFGEQPDVGSRVRTAFQANTDRDAIIAYRKAWYACQEGMNIGAKALHKFRYQGS